MKTLRYSIFDHFCVSTNHTTDCIFTSFEAVAEHRPRAVAARAARKGRSMDGSLGLHSYSAVQSMNTEPDGSAWPKKEYLITYKLGVYLSICIWECIQFCAPVFVGHAADFNGSAVCYFSKRSNTVIKILVFAHFVSYWFPWFIPLKFTFLLSRTQICVNVNNRKAMTFSLATGGWLGVEDNSRICRDAEVEFSELLGHQQSETGLSHLSRETFHKGV